MLIDCEKDCKQLIDYFLTFRVSWGLPDITCDLLDVAELVDVVPLLAAGFAGGLLPCFTTFGVKATSRKRCAAAVGAVATLAVDVLFFGGGLEYVEFFFGLSDGFRVVLTATSLGGSKEFTDLFHAAEDSQFYNRFNIVAHGEVLDAWCWFGCFLTMNIIADNT